MDAAYRIVEMSTCDSPCIPMLRATYILTMTDSGRTHTINPILLRLSRQIYVQYNDGFRNVPKADVDNTSRDLVHAIRNICFHAEKEGYVDSGRRCHAFCQNAQIIQFGQEPLVVADDEAADSSSDSALLVVSRGGVKMSRIQHSSYSSSPMKTLSPCRTPAGAAGVLEQCDFADDVAGAEGGDLAAHMKICCCGSNGFVLGQISQSWYIVRRNRREGHGSIGGPMII